MKKLTLLSILTLLVGLISCKKENTTWQTDWNTPLVHGNLTLSDMIPAENLIENSENFASLIFKDTLYSFKIDTLIKLPDTTLVQKAVTSFPSLTLGPGNLISSIGIDQLYDLGQIQLKNVKVREGTAVITITSPWQGKSKVIFTFSKTLDGNGDMFTREYFLPPGSQANPSVFSETISMKDFDFDLTGTDGTLLNNITADVHIVSAEETDYFTVSNTDTVVIKMEFKDMTAKYAKGYFGEYVISDTTTVTLSQLKKITAGTFNLDSINLGLQLNNGFKLFTQATFHLLKGINTTTTNAVELMFPQLNNSININPASGGLYDYVASTYSIPVNSGNSNVIPFIENLSDKIDIGYTIHINPYGNTTAGDDEYFPNSSLDLLLDAELPLKLAIDNLTLQDTIALSFKQNSSANLNKALITLDYDNGFPLESTASIQLLSVNNNVIGTISSSSIIESGSFNVGSGLTTPTSGKVKFDLNSDDIKNIEKAVKMVFTVSFSTHQSSTIKINVDDYFNFNLFSDLNIQFKY